MRLAPDSFARLRGPLVLFVLCGIPVALWAGSAPLDSRFEGRFLTLTSIAVILAYAGTSAFALNLVLGARLRPVEALFGGLERMYDVHRVNGQIAFVLLLGHVAFILASRATISTSTALDLLHPGAGWTVFAGVLAFSGLTLAILLTLFARLGHELFVYVQRSFGLVFLGATYHVFTTPGARDDSRALNLYMASLATLGIAAWGYRSVLGNLLVRRRKYRVAAVNRLDEFVTEVALEPRDRPLEHAPGQFLFVNFREPFSAQFPPFFRNQFHPFSITSAPGEPRLRITVKAVGDYTRALRALEPGVDAVVEGPYGCLRERGDLASPADLDRRRDRGHALPEHGPEPERRRAPRSTSTTASSTSRRRTSSTSSARSSGSATASGSSSCRATATASSPPSGSRRRTRISRPPTCSSAGRRR